MAADPFHAFHSDLRSTLSTTRPLLQSYLRIRSTSPSPNSPELVDARKDLESALQDISTDLQDLIDSVRAVESNPYQFGVDTEEVKRRRKLVDDVRREVEDMRGQVRDTAARADGSAPGSAGVPGSGLPDPGAFEDEEGDESYREFEEQRQQELLHEQDEMLDGVFSTVTTLRRQADDMGRELEEQAEMLDQVDNLADRVGGKLQNGLKKIAWVARKNEDTYSTCCIGLLIIVLIVLLLLLLLL